MIVSLERALSKLGFCSRAEAAKKIEAGLVTIDGKIVKNPRLRVYLDAKIAVEGNVVQKQEPVYFVVYKPRNVVTTRNDPQGRRTIYDVIAVPAYVFPVGRLDYDSSGLLIMTNDGKFADFITDPASKVEKVYWAKVKGEFDLSRLREGVRVEGEMLAAKRVKRLKKNPLSMIIEVVITEGKNRQVRRMIEAIGGKVLALKRVAIGKLLIGDLKSGGCKQLGKKELKLLGWDSV